MCSSSGCACPTSVGIDFAQCAQTVRSVGFASARHALPLGGKGPPPISPHHPALPPVGFAPARHALPLVGKGRPPISPPHLQAARQASSGLGGRRVSNRG